MDPGFVFRGRSARQCKQVETSLHCTWRAGGLLWPGERPLFTGVSGLTAASLPVLVMGKCTQTGAQLDCNVNRNRHRKHSANATATARTTATATATTSATAIAAATKITAMCKPGRHDKGDFPHTHSLVPSPVWTGIPRPRVRARSPATAAEHPNWQPAGCTFHKLRHRLTARLAGGPCMS